MSEARQDLAHALGGDDKHVVACGVAERIVDLLEAVEVDLYDGHTLVAALGTLDQRVEMIGEEGAVVKAGQPIMHGEERHRIARVHQLVGLAQNHIRHRPEDEQGDEDDDADGGIEERPVQRERAVEAGIGERADAVAEGGEAFERGVGHGLVEHSRLLSGAIVGAGYAKLGLQRRNEAPAVRREFGREQIQMIGPLEEYVLHGLGIEAGERLRIRTSLLEEHVVVGLEFGYSLAQRSNQRRLVLPRRVADSAGEEHHPLRQGLLRARQREQRVVALLRRHHLLQQDEGRHCYRGDDQKRDPIGALDQRNQLSGAGVHGLLLQKWLSEATGFCFHAQSHGRRKVNARRNCSAVYPLP